MGSLAKTIASRENNYNTIRFVLAASVIFSHSFGLTKAVGYTDYTDNYLYRFGLDVGGLAVDCFFLLSGLFVTQSFYRDRSPFNFAIRRFCRIWPGLFVCLAVTAIIACLLAKRLDAWMYLFEPNFYKYVTSNSVLSLVWEIPGVFENHPYAVINGSIHTLPTEVKMYVIVLCGGILTLFRRRGAILLFAACMMAVALFDYDACATPLSIPSNGQAPMAMFFAGVALFAIADHVHGTWWLAGVSLCLAFLLPHPWNTACALATAASAMIALGRMKGVWRPKSDVSYGLYIYGWPCQQFILTFLPSLNPYILTGCALLLAWGFAVLSWRIVEKPAIFLGHGLTATWTDFRHRGGLSSSIEKLLSIAALPRIATIGVVFLLCVGMSWASERLNIVPIAPLDTTIVGFGPTEARVGQGFNVQPSGLSALWVTFDHPPPRGTQIVFDGEPLDTMLSSTAATALVPDALIASAGDKRILLEFRIAGQRRQSAPVIMRVTK